MDANSKYYALFEHLLFSGQGHLRMTFAEIERVVRKPLPPSARRRTEWWSNNPSGHSQANAWRRASYRTQSINLKEETVDFLLEGWPEQFQRPSLTQGFGEAEQAKYRSPPQDENQGEEKPHPLFGIWRGKVTLLPDYDYTQPLDPDGTKAYDD